MQRVILLLPFLLCAFVSDATGSSRSSEIASATADSARIAFMQGARKLVVVDADGRNQRTVVRLRPRFEIVDFKWDPSGRRIAFEATTPLGKERLYVIGADGRGWRRLAQWEDYSSVLAWSPRGRTILFDKQNDGEHQFWVINANGSGARKLTPLGWFTDATWSPDGRRIAFHGRAGKRQATGIHMMSANGRYRRLIIRGGGAPVWSPTNKIAFYRGDDLWIANPDGSGQRIVITADPKTWSPSRIGFSPDGGRVAFSRSYAVRNGELMIGDVVTGGVQRLTTTNTLDEFGPSWSPDGNSLAFTRYRPNGPDPEDDEPTDIYVMNADGSGVRNLTNSAADEHSPAWAPQ